MDGTLAHVENDGAQWWYDADQELFTRYKNSEAKGTIHASDIPDPDTFNNSRVRPINETVVALWRFLNA